MLKLVGKMGPLTCFQAFVVFLVGWAFKENGVALSMMNKEDPAFCELFLTLDIATSSLHHKGVGAMKVKASVIYYEHEAMFWEKITA